MIENMSSLIFRIEQHEVLVATDTLAVLNSGLPSHFTTKALILPHLRLLIAGTGVAGFLDRWFLQVNTSLVTRDVDSLNYLTPESLLSLWEVWCEEFPTQASDNTTTVYHFGFSVVTGQIHSYVYRSENGFTSRKLLHGLHTKPECTPIQGPRFSRDVMKMMKEQRVLQAVAQGKRVYIGGEVWLHRLNQSGFRVSSLGRLDDFSEIEEGMYQKFK